MDIEYAKENVDTAIAAMEADGDKDWLFLRDYAIKEMNCDGGRYRHFSKGKRLGEEVRPYLPDALLPYRDDVTLDDVKRLIKSIMFTAAVLDSAASEATSSGATFDLPSALPDGEYALKELRFLPIRLSSAPGSEEPSDSVFILMFELKGSPLNFIGLGFSVATPLSAAAPRDIGDTRVGVVRWGAMPHLYQPGLRIVDVVSKDAITRLLNA